MDLHGGAEALAVLWLHPDDQDFWSHGFDGKSSSCKRKHTVNLMILLMEFLTAKFRSLVNEK
jgi:hypothetical protein